MPTKDELKTVHHLIQTLNLYQVLKLKPLATEDEIRDAFHREALAFHPDQYFSEEDEDLKKLSKDVYTRVVEAYRTLSDRKRRAEYDQQLNKSSRVRLEKDSDEMDENAITAVQQKKKASPGDKFYKLADQAFKNRDYRSAMMNIQIALGSDPGNKAFLQFKNKLDSIMKVQKK